LKKKLLFLTHGLRGGGTQKYVRDMANYMAVRGYEVSVFILSKQASNTETLESYYFTCYHVPLAKNLQQTLSNFYDLLDAYAFDFDAVFANSYDSYKLLNVQDRIPTSRQFYVIHADYFGMYYRWYKPLANFKRSVKYRKLFNGKQLIVNSEGVKQNLYHKIGVRPKNVEIIPPPVDISAIYASLTGTADFAPELPENFIVVIGTLSALKRVELAIDLMQYLPDDLHLVIIGSGSEENRLKLRASKYKQRVLFLGWLENPYPILSKAKCLVNMSFSEGFSYVLVESLVLGVPALSIKSDGPESILKQTHPEWLFENSQMVVQEMANFIDHMPNYDSEKLMKEVQQFDISNTFIQYEKILNV